MAASGFGFVFLLVALSPHQLPMDLLGLVDPAAGLKILGKEADETSLAKLISAPAGGAEAPPLAPEAAKTAESAIQNLASQSDAVRKRAREQLAEIGAALRPRLEEVVAKDARRAEEAKKVLALLDDQASAAGHEVEISRILAMRLAAERKATGLLSAIRKEAEAKDPFVRGAAEDALLWLGEKVEPPAAAAEGAPGLKEIEALPAETRVLLAYDLQLPKPGSKTALTLKDHVERIKASAPAGLPPLEGLAERGSRAVLEWVRTYGNLRPERVFLANVGGVGPQGGGIGFIIQGRYQPGVLRRALGEAKGPSWSRSEVAGLEVYASESMKLALLNERAVLVVLGNEASAHFPLEEFLKNCAAGKNAIGGQKRLAQFLETIKGKFEVRGLAITDETLMGEGYKEMEGDAPEDLVAAVKGLKEVEFTVNALEDSKLRIRFQGEFTKAEHATELTEFFKAQIAESIAQMEQFQAFAPPFFKTYIEAMKAIKLSAEGTQGILRLEMPALRIEEFVPFFGFMGEADFSEVEDFDEE
jgi:hypothetical protein